MAIPNRRTSSLTRSRPTSNLPPRQHVQVEVVDYNIVDKKKSNPDKDQLNGILKHDVPAWDMKKGTPVVCMMPPNADGKGARRRDVYGLSKPKGQGAAMDTGSTVIFERAYFDRKDNTLKAPYSHGCANKAQLDSGLKIVYDNMLVCVSPEGTYAGGENKGKPVGRVDVMIADVNGAEEIADRAQLEEAVAALVSNPELIGNPGFQLLVRKNAFEGDIAPEGFNALEFSSNPENRFGAFVAARQNRVGEGAEAVYVRETAEEVMARFEAQCTYLDEVLEDPTMRVFFVPMMVVNQANSLVPSKVAEGDRVRDNSLFYALYDQIPEEEQQGVLGLIQTSEGVLMGQNEVGWTTSHVVVERKEIDSDYYYCTYEAAMSQGNDVTKGEALVSVHDIVLPIMVEDPRLAPHLVAIKSEAARLGEMGKTYRQTLKAIQDSMDPNAAPAADEQATAPGGP